MTVAFKWDPAKAASNLRKHGVSFEMAKEIFADPNHVVIENDHVQSQDEQRSLIIGMTGALILLAVIFVDQSDPTCEVIRIISARKAVAYEQSIYEDQNC